MRNRYEGTRYSPDETGRTDMRVIGTDTSMSVHALQVYPDLPTEMSCVTWECVGPAPYGVFVPVSNASLSASRSYAKNQPYSEIGNFDDDKYPYYTFKEINTLCVEKATCKVYGAPVRAYWEKAEEGMISGMGRVLSKASKSKDKDEAAKLITDYCNKQQELAFEDGKHVLNDIKWYMSYNSNTMKNGRNPENDEVYDTLVEIDPLDLGKDKNLNVSEYGR